MSGVYGCVNDAVTRIELLNEIEKLRAELAAARDSLQECAWHFDTTNDYSQVTGHRLAKEAIARIDEILK